MPKLRRPMITIWTYITLTFSFGIFEASSVFLTPACDRVRETEDTSKTTDEKAYKSHSQRTL